MFPTSPVSYPVILYSTVLISSNKYLHSFPIELLQVFVARCSFILRGMATMLGKQVHTSLRWKKYAEDALESL